MYLGVKLDKNGDYIAEWRRICQFWPQKEFKTMEEIKLGGIKFPKKSKSKKQLKDFNHANPRISPPNNSPIPLPQKQAPPNQKKVEKKSWKFPNSARYQLLPIRRKHNLPLKNGPPTAHNITKLARKCFPTNPSAPKSPALKVGEMCADIWNLSGWLAGNKRNFLTFASGSLLLEDEQPPK